MSPHKQPKSLLKSCIESCVVLINSACYIIEKRSENCDYAECEAEAVSFKLQLMSVLPARLFDVLCSHRTYCKFNGDPRIQLIVLTHPQMTVFRKCDIDNGIPQTFWLKSLPNFKRLLVLDLKFICTNEILEVIGKNCLLLENINIVSKVDICKSIFNASVLVRSVSDAGLCHIKNLKQLRILAMDPPRNLRANRVGRCVSQAGIISLISELPYLEELKIESCDMGAAVVTSDGDVGPLSLRKMSCHYISAEGIKKLIRICPFLKELLLTHLYEHNKDAVLEQISVSDLRLNRLGLMFFSFSKAMQHLLVVKGSYLTDFSFGDIDHSLSIENVVTLGKCCPNLISLCLTTKSRNLVKPQYIIPNTIFTKLSALTIGNDHFDINHMMTFFLTCAQNLQRLMVRYETKLNVDDILMQLLEKGSLKNVQFLWLDCTLEVSKDVMKLMIQKCDQLKMLTVDHQDDISDVHKYISENNLDFKLGSYIVT